MGKFDNATLTPIIRKQGVFQILALTLIENEACFSLLECIHRIVLKCPDSVTLDESIIHDELANRPIPLFLFNLRFMFYAILSSRHAPLQIKHIVLELSSIFLNVFPNWALFPYNESFKGKHMKFDSGIFLTLLMKMSTIEVC